MVRRAPQSESVATCERASARVLKLKLVVKHVAAHAGQTGCLKVAPLVGSFKHRTVSALRAGAEAIWPWGGAGGYLPQACKQLTRIYNSEVVGQTLVLKDLQAAVCQHVQDPHSTKPLVVMLSGPPGVGKSETSRQTAKVCHHTLRGVPQFLGLCTLDLSEHVSSLEKQCLKMKPLAKHLEFCHAVFSILTQLTSMTLIRNSCPLLDWLPNW